MVKKPGRKKAWMVQKAGLNKGMNLSLKLLDEWVEEEWKNDAAVDLKNYLSGSASSHSNILGRKGSSKVQTAKK